MRIIWKLLWILGLFASAINAEARQLLVDSARYHSEAGTARVVFDVSGEPAHEIFMLDNPTRLVIDISNAHVNGTLAQPPVGHPMFVRVRSAARNKHDLRVVLDLKQGVKPKSFALKPNKTFGHRLVIDLLSKGHIKLVSKSKKTPPLIKKSKVRKARDIIVAVDAGHGGEDPGAHGRYGTKEKKVVFEIASKLARLINNQAGMKAVMVRKGDYKVKLRKRMEIARKAKADLFISIHADAFKSAKVKGASVFTISRRGASSEAARWLAKHENAVDLVGGVSLDDKDDVLASVLMDLSQTATKEASREVAAKVLHNFGRIGKLHKNGVQKAGFMVLKSPDIPSILVETAFISNPSEERKLRDSRHQAKMAKAIFKGVLSYFKENAPIDTRMAAAQQQQNHVISRGDTLSAIAQQYGVSMKTLKSANRMRNSHISVGQVLKIPADS